jgi:UDP-N-acetylglucosamine 1-carboxyvinyltransferase
MSSYILEGGNILEGIVDISGSKNASLPILAASILNGGISKLYNVPNIHDTQITLKILRILGCKVYKKNGKIIMDSSKMEAYEIPEDLMRQMRSSVVLAGAILARFKNVIFTYPRRMRYWIKTNRFTFEIIKKIRNKYR